MPRPPSSFDSEVTPKDSVTQYPGKWSVSLSSANVAGFLLFRLFLLHGKSFQQCIAIWCCARMQPNCYWWRESNCPKKTTSTSSISAIRILSRFVALAELILDDVSKSAAAHEAESSGVTDRPRRSNCYSVTLTSRDRKNCVDQKKPREPSYSGLPTTTRLWRHVARTGRLMDLNSLNDATHWQIHGYPTLVPGRDSFFNEMEMMHLNVHPLVQSWQRTPPSSWRSRPPRTDVCSTNDWSPSSTGHRS